MLVNADSDGSSRRDGLETLRGSSVLDTASLLGRLREQYARRGRRIEVDFRQLVHWIRVGDQLTHQIHPYPAKLLPHIAHFFVRSSSLSNTDDIVLDPFCGSGTVALEATICGRRAYAADANPLALLLAKVKTHPYDVGGLREVASALARRVRRLRSAPSIDIVNAHLWYSPEKMTALQLLARVVNEVEDEYDRDFFKVCLSVTARRVSNADPAISVPVRLKPKLSLADGASRKVAEKLAWIAAADPVEEFLKACHANINRIEATNRVFPGRQSLSVAGSDARALVDPERPLDALPAKSVRLIVTSPPYGSAQKYVRASSLSLNWLGMAAPSDLSFLESLSIGREHMPQHRILQLPADLPRPYEALLNRIEKKNPTRMLITRQYLHDMRAALKEMARVLQPGGHVALVIGNNQVCGEPLRNDTFIETVLREEGLTLDLALVDDIKSRGLMTKRNKTASVISRESVLLFKK